MKKTVFTYNKLFADGFNFKVTAVNGHSTNYRVLITYGEHIVAHSSGSSKFIGKKEAADIIVETRNEFLKYENDKDFLQLLDN